jgi:hypothetical protein
MLPSRQTSCWIDSSMTNKLRSIGNGEAFEGISMVNESARSKGHERRGNTYPRNARSLLESPASAPAASSPAPCSRSSTGKYDVSVIDRKRGTKGASIRRMLLQSTP